MSTRWVGTGRGYIEPPPRMQAPAAATQTPAPRDCSQSARSLVVADVPVSILEQPANSTAVSSAVAVTAFMIWALREI
jgi:hypothetical protein